MTKVKTNVVFNFVLNRYDFIKVQAHDSTPHPQTSIFRNTLTQGSRTGKNKPTTITVQWFKKINLADIKPRVSALDEKQCTIVQNYKGKKKNLAVYQLLHW